TPSRPPRSSARTAPRAARPCAGRAGRRGIRGPRAPSCGGSPAGCSGRGPAAQYTVTLTVADWQPVFVAAKLIEPFLVGVTVKVTVPFVPVLSVVALTPAPESFTVTPEITFPAAFLMVMVTLPFCFGK